MNGVTNVSLPPTLSWNSSSGATSYTLQVSTNSSFTSFVYNQDGITGTSLQISGLNNLTKYYWRVSATNNYGTSGWSSVWNFTTVSGGSNGLVAYYPFNGNANDESGSGNNGTTNTATLTNDRHNNSNSAYMFNGSTKILAPTNNLPTGNANRSISVWVKSSDFGQGNRMLVGWGTAPTQYKMSAIGLGHSYSTNRKPFFWGYGEDLIANTALTNNQWNHIVFTYESGVGKIYINGLLDSTKNLSLNTPAGSILNIGWFNLTLSGFSGAIDDIRIYNRALLANEIVDLYNE